MEALEETKTAPDAYAASLTEFIAATQAFAAAIQKLHASTPADDSPLRDEMATHAMRCAVPHCSKR